MTVRLFHSLIAAMIATLALLAQAAFALECPYSGPCHIESSFQDRVYARMDYKAIGPLSFHASQWVAFAAKAPVTGGQSDTSSRMVIDGQNAATLYELSPEHRAVLALRFPGLIHEHDFPAVCEYWANVRERHLADGAATSPVPPLSSNERAMYLCATPWYDYSSPRFRQWLRQNNLVRYRGEAPIQFAWRAFDFIRTHYTYRYEEKQDRHASAICAEAATDCGGCSYLLVSMLRANGIPARALIGRWLRSKPVSQRGSEYGTNHVKSEFYADGIGWVPVEMSVALGADDREAISCFGHDEGRFLTMQIDPGVDLDSVFFGTKECRELQQIRYWAIGEGDLNGTHQLTWTCYFEHAAP